MTEQQAVEYLHSLPRMGTKPTLERMRALMARLGDPQKNLKFVHVAGTNGKGTVCTLTAAILQKAGFKVGLTISPFVLDFRERFQVNGQMIPKRDLGRLTALVTGGGLPLVCPAGVRPGGAGNRPWGRI